MGGARRLVSNAHSLLMIWFGMEWRIFVEIENYLGFTGTGIYRVTIYARDANGLVAQPVIMEVNTHHRQEVPMVNRWDL